MNKNRKAAFDLKSKIIVESRAMLEREKRAERKPRSIPRASRSGSRVASVSLERPVQRRGPESRESKEGTGASLPKLIVQEEHKQLRKSVRQTQIELQNQRNKFRQSQERLQLLRQTRTRQHLHRLSSEQHRLAPLFLSFRTLVSGFLHSHQGLGPLIEALSQFKHIAEVTSLTQQLASIYKIYQQSDNSFGKAFNQNLHKMATALLASIQTNIHNHLLRPTQLPFSSKEIQLYAPAQKCRVLGEECDICLESVGWLCQIRTLGCGHMFHKSCVDEWLRNKDLCPKCRGVVYSL